MNTFHSILQKFLLVIFLCCFTVVSTYVPHNLNLVKKVEAGAASGGALEITQIKNYATLEKINAVSMSILGASTVTSANTGASLTLDNVLDGIAWALAKNVLSQMTASIVAWVNSGFKGSPAFVQNMEGFLVGVADQTMGAYLEELGGPFSFVCSPFQLDVRVALAATYELGRDGQPASTCTLSGALANLEGFINGTDPFVDGGGWESWFAITANPTQYTPFGSIEAAKVQASARITNAKGQELELLNYGNGFLSSKICETVQGAGTTRENCFISTPGKVINEALTFQTSAGPRSLIAADEINEIISAVFGQLTQQAITGAAGLLGLSGGTGYTSDPIPFTDQIAAAGNSSNPAQLLDLMSDARTIEVNFLALASTSRPLLVAYNANLTNPGDRRQAVRDELDEIAILVPQINSNITALNALITDYALVDLTSSTATQSIQAISQRFFALKDLHSEAEVDGKEVLWKTLIR